MNVSPQGSCVEDLVPRFTAWCLEMGPWGMVKKKWENRGGTTGSSSMSTKLQRDIEGPGVL